MMVLNHVREMQGISQPLTDEYISLRGAKLQLLGKTIVKDRVARAGAGPGL